MIRTYSSLSFALIACLSVTACSSGDVAVGANGQALKRTPGGGATGNGRTCSWDDPAGDGGTPAATANAPYKIGDTFKSPDGCNDCSCAAEGIYCTERACAPGGTCAFDGKTYAAGDRFKSTDGCNTCSCGSDGTVACTEMACVAPAGTCNYGGKTYKPGDSFPSTDGCNSCGCEANGQVACTAIACPPACQTDAKQCPDGSYVGRTGPKCEFVCP